MPDIQFHIDVTLLVLLASTVVPFLVGLVVKTNASSRFKAVANTVLSALAGGLAVAIAADGKVVLAAVLTAMLQTVIGSNATYHGIWKPTGIAASVAGVTGNSALALGTVVPPLELTRPATASKKAPAKRAPAKKKQ